MKDVPEMLSHLTSVRIFLRRMSGGTYLTETPAEADNITLSDPMIVSPLLLEKTVFLLGSDNENLPAVTCKPVLSGWESMK